MGRNSVVAIFLLVTGFGIGYLVRGLMETSHRAGTRAADLAAIEKLHRTDIAATLAQDPDQLINLWSDDCVKLGVPGPAIIGKKGI